MRILITNDDGIQAPGLSVLYDIARAVAGESGEVWTVAPSDEQSGVGHCISYTKPVLLTALSERRYMVSGTPADCVMAAPHVLGDQRLDLILSGVNRGNNAAENVMYSGTIGAAIEGALNGVLSIALSQYFGPENASLEQPFESAAAYGACVVRSICEQHERLNAGEDDYGLFYNVNFPPCAGAAVKGVRVVRQGRRTGVVFSSVPQQSPSGRSFLWAKGGDQHVQTAQGSDAAANLAHYISVTPMRADLTAHGALDAMRECEEEFKL